MVNFFIYKRSLEELVEAYVASRNTTRCVSISHAIRAIQAFRPAGAQNRELTNLIATAAIKRNLPIHFDRSRDIDGFTDVGAPSYPEA